MKKKILVVDDDPRVLDLTEQILEEEGYDIVTFSTPLGVVKKVQEEKPDLLLMDLNMPALDGDKVCRVLRKYEMGTPIPIVIFSATALDQLQKMVEQCGANGYIQKATPPDEFVKAVARFLKSN